jgi:hypothetical protein
VHEAKTNLFDQDSIPWQPAHEYNTLLHSVIMRSLHDVHEMNGCTADNVRLSAWFNSRAAARISTKFGLDVLPLEATLKSYLFNFLQSVISTWSSSSNLFNDAFSASQTI